MTIKEKVAYLQGLLSGVELDESSKEVKVIKAIVDVLDDMAMLISDNEEDLVDLNDRVDEIDEDLAEVEEELFGECDCDCDDACDCCGGDDDDAFYEVTCPTCGKEICLNESILDEGGIECPSCGEALEFDFDDGDDEDGCCCGGSCDCGDKEKE